MTDNQNENSQNTETSDLEKQAPQSLHTESEEFSTQKSPQNSDEHYLKKTQTLLFVSNIGGPVSLFIGGVFLSTAGLVCAILAYRRLIKFSTQDPQAKLIALRLKRSSIVGLIICSIALVLNIATLIYVMPLVLEVMETGDFNAILSDTPSSGTTATWG